MGLASGGLDAQPSASLLDSAVSAAAEVLGMFPESECLQQERSSDRAAATTEDAVSPSRGPVELQPDLAASPGGWESTLSGLQKMHVDLKKSLEAATKGEEHATKLLANMSDVRARIDVPKED